MTKQIRLGAIFWLLTAEFFIAQFLAQAAWPGYSMAIEDISLLGVTSCGAYLNPAPGGIMPVCSPLSLLFNIGMTLNGVLVVLGVWFTRDLWPQTRLKLVALWLLALGGDGTMLAGLFPLDTMPVLHLVGAVLALGLSCFGFIALARVVWHSHRAFALYCPDPALPFHCGRENTADKGNTRLSVALPWQMERSTWQTTTATIPCPPLCPGTDRNGSSPPGPASASSGARPAWRPMPISSRAGRRRCAGPPLKSGASSAW